jgi:hypothetical protein
MSTNLIHPKYTNIIKETLKLGEVTTGILIDKVVASYSKFF